MGDTFVNGLAEVEDDNSDSVAVKDHDKEGNDSSDGGDRYERGIVSFLKEFGESDTD